MRSIQDYFSLFFICVLRPAASAIPGGRGSLREEAATVGLGLRPAASSHGHRLSRQHAAAVGGALAVGSSWASAGLPGAEASAG